MSTTAYISMGSNIGNREGNLRAAIERLRELGNVTAISSLYETEPVEFTEQPWFLNCVVALETERTPRELLEGMLEMERAMGRERVQPKGPRVIDLDIVLFGEQIVEEPQLEIPHPAMHLRRFVLEPLAEIAPEAKHPRLNQKARQILADLPRQGPEVRRL
ncbi:MAG TPA: 2-amino-4-hydroxy-6-hydroxymethyldihydropteridine diphosphokinase [Terriglobales bacterium]|nr:2-amino-4-hydroxy-6-hydroxymethyldihydropteridine diphosphokinase [Terriglobales bacterium]